MERMCDIDQSHILVIEKIIRISEFIHTNLYIKGVFVMRSIAVLLSTLMFVALIIGTYIYEKQDPISLPQIAQPSESLEQQPESLRPVTNETISYTLQKSE